MDAIKVYYKDHWMGAISYDIAQNLGSFQYATGFIKTGIELSPLKMPLSDRVYTFRGLDYDTFRGLPGLVADSLPDDFGNAVLDAWVSEQGRTPSSITPLERLQYTGTRGMGALEYKPEKLVRGLSANRQIHIESLVHVAQNVLDERNNFSAALPSDGREDREVMMSLLSVGMSAGGARPKAVLAFSQDFTQVRSGQVTVPEGFTHYLMKFDGVTQASQNRETFGDPMGFGAMEYVYYLMAADCGVDMMFSRLLDEGPRRHFVTQRFDRLGNDKVHVQTLNGLAHISYKRPGEFSYAQLFGVARELKLDSKDAEQLLRRMIFNIVARNHDDHSKNFAFMLRPDNSWGLAPAYDVAYSYKPGNKWINSHWMTLNGKRDDFVRDDIHSLRKLSPLFKPQRVNQIIDQVIESVSRWEILAKEHEVPNALINEVQENLRLNL